MTSIKSYLVSAIMALVFHTGDTLWATPNHPFWYKDQYVEAEALSVGDTLTAADGSTEVIINTFVKDTTLKVYNFTVEDNHNYYVGNSGLLVHNDCFLDRIKNSPGLVAAIDELPSGLKGKFIEDFFEAGDDVLEVLKRESGCVRAWEKLANRDQWVRTNTDLLKKLVDKSDDFIVKIDELYSPTVMKLPPTLKPPNRPPGRFLEVDYDKFGFPILESHVSDKGHVVKIVMDGSNDDYMRAYDELKGIIGEGNIQFTNQYGSSFKIRQADGTFNGPAYTWHHHQDGVSMMPVLQTVHQSIQNYHIGGRAVVNRGLKGLFDPPQF